MSGDLSAEDTAELDLYREWLHRIYTPDETRPQWFNADTWVLRPMPPPPLEGRARRGYNGRHRPAAASWWSRLASWWRVNSQPVPWKENDPGHR